MYDSGGLDNNLTVVWYSIFPPFFSEYGHQVSYSARIAQCDVIVRKVWILSAFEGAQYLVFDAAPLSANQKRNQSKVSDKKWLWRDRLNGHLKSQSPVGQVSVSMVAFSVHCYPSRWSSGTMLTVSSLFDCGSLEIIETFPKKSGSDPEIHLDLSRRSKLYECQEHTYATSFRYLFVVYRVSLLYFISPIQYE